MRGQKERVFYKKSYRYLHITEVERIQALNAVPKILGRTRKLMIQIWGSNFSTLMANWKGLLDFCLHN